MRTSATRGNDDGVARCQRGITQIRRHAMSDTLGNAKFYSTNPWPRPVYFVVMKGLHSMVQMLQDEERKDRYAHLLSCGYAPGDYMSRCHVCEDLVYNVDKRAITCRPCAEILHSEARTEASEIVP